VIITISGRPGSGKSAVAARVGQALGLEHVSAGDFMREMAAEQGMSILEFSRKAESREAIDNEIDARTVRIASEKDDLVVDARLGWHFVPDSVKVFLDVRPEIAASRIFGAARGSERENKSFDETVRAINERMESERRRYHSYYNIDYADLSQYDLVIDTSDKQIDDVVEEIVGFVEGL
jgi:cytidylate kinase